MSNDYTTDYDVDDGASEVECLDCGCDIITDGIEFRCDTCRDHYNQDCGDDCPIICENCKEHHFAPCLEPNRYLYF